MSPTRITPIFPEEGKRRSLYIYALCLTADDEADVSAALIAEFPGIVFRVLVWNEFGHRMYPDPPDPVAAEARRVSRLPPELRDPKYRFASYLTDYPEQSEIHAYLPEEGWVPQWKRAADGRWVNWNAPKKWFALSRSSYFSTATRTASYQPRAAVLAGEHIRLTGGDFHSTYNTADAEQAKFARRCKRIFLKHTTNRYAQVDTKTGTLRMRIERGNSWIGFHALRWAAAHPRQFASESLKPYDWQPPGKSPA